MAFKVNKKENIIARLNSEGKEQRMDSHDNNVNREEINLQMEIIMRDFQQKEYESQISASQFVLTK